MQTQRFISFTVSLPFKKYISNYSNLKINDENFKVFFILKKRQTLPPVAKGMVLSSNQQLMRTNQLCSMYFSSQQIYVHQVQTI